MTTTTTKPTKPLTNRSTKTEILKAYQALAREAQQADRGEPAAPTSTALATLSTAAQEQIMTQPSTTIETIIRDLKGVRARLGESMGTLQQQLLGEATRLQALRSEADERTAQLKALHGIEVDDGSLRGLVRKYQETQASADEAHAARKQAVEAELAAAHAAWRAEQGERARAHQEAEEATARAHEREAVEYGYEVKRTHEADADALTQARKTQQAQLAAAEEAHARRWAEREQALASREQEYAQLQARAAAAPKELEAAIARADAEGTGIAKRQAKLTADLLQKADEGKRRVFGLKVAALEETIARQNEQVSELSKQLATALKQAQDLALKAIDGASSSSSFAAVKEIALEQAKTSQKAK